MEDNSHAGQGAVVLDIGGDIGALVIVAPPELEGVEIEARPQAHLVPGFDLHHWHDHGLGEHSHAHLEHVAVVPRPVPGGGHVHSAVFAALPEGTYELYERPAGPVRLTAEVRGGAVTETVWP